MNFLINGSASYILDISPLSIHKNASLLKHTYVDKHHYNDPLHQVPQQHSKYSIVIDEYGNLTKY